jgi:hypothetical protein
MLNQFLNGAIMMGFLVAALFFLRFWRRTSERLLAIFAAAFFVFAIERIVLAFVRSDAELYPYIYLIRLSGFLLIIIAIIDKNRDGTHRTTGTSAPNPNSERLDR